MVKPNEKSPDQQILDLYQSFVSQTHADLVPAWPLLSGHNTKIASFSGWLIVILEHTGNTAMISSSGLGELNRGLTGVQQIEPSNKPHVRSRLEKHFNLKPSDAVVFIDPQGDIADELQLMLQRHEFAMGVTPMKIFLSHKGADKPLVREFKNTLELLGFDCWLDEDAMSAGTELERGLLQGFADSCAAVFFVTPKYADENFLASEVDYAIQEKRKKGDKFSIITLVFQEGANKGKVPELLHRYVWKEPATHLEALREIVKALPIQVGDAYWRQT
ncbi:MAG: toll/interleukin-1 receptor domain-containing protein [Gallionella sp.]|nr:toll/interleukin-1 receptor domain-containing protein [Gallionella sp.]